MNMIMIKEEDFAQMNEKLDKVLTLLETKNEDTKLYNISETAEQLGVTRQTLHNYIRYGQIETITVGNRTYFTKRIITNFLQNENSKHITHRTA